MIAHLERAAQAIENLHITTQRLNEETARMDSPPQVLNEGEEIIADSVPEDFISGCREAIQAILDALAPIDRSVYRLPPRKPPEWWRHLDTLITSERAKYAATHPAFINAFDILYRHVRDEDSRLGLLVFLVEDLDRKIVRSRSTNGFMAYSGPYTQPISFAFDPSINNDVDTALRKLLSEVFIFPESCVRLLRNALNETRDIFDHFGIPKN